MGETTKTLEKTFVQVAENEQQQVSKNDGLDFATHLLKMQLLFEVNYDITVGMGTVTLNEDDVLNFVQNIKLQANTIGEIRNLSGELLWKLNYYLSRVQSTRNVPITNGAGKIATLVLDIYFTMQDAYGIKQKIAGLWRNDSGELALTIQYGALSDIFTLAGGASAVFNNVTLTITITEDPDLVGHIPVLIMNSKQVNLDGTTEQNELMNLAYPTRIFAYRAEDNSNLNSDTELEKIRLRLDNVNIVMTDTYASMLQANRTMLPEGLIVGFAIRNFDPDHDYTGVRDFRAKITEFLLDSAVTGGLVEICSVMVKP